MTLVYVFGDGLTVFSNRCSQPDTVTYYYAARAALAGNSAYDYLALSRDYGDFVMRWVYPPSALPIFIPLTVLPLDAATNVFDILKAVAVVGLIFVWRALFPSLRRDVAFWLFAIVALNTTFLQDFCAGNIAVFESLAIWSAVLLIKRQRYSYAVALILLLSLVKPLWLVLLALPLLMAWRDRRARIAVAVAAPIAAAALILWWMIDRGSFYDWMSNARATLPIRYNVFELAKDIRLRLGGALDVPSWQRPEYPLFALWAVLVAWLIWRRWRAGENSVALGLLLVLAMVAVGPANLSYSWVLAVPIVYLAMFQVDWPWRGLIALLAIVPPALAAMVMPVHLVAMTPLVAIMVAYLVFALQTPHRSTNLQTID